MLILNQLTDTCMCNFFIDQMHHDPKPKDTDSEDEAGVERKKPEGSWFPPKREKGSNTSDVSSTKFYIFHS